MDTSTTSQNEKTLLCFTVDHRQPGALCDALYAFKKHNINLSKMDARPSSNLEIWHYFFFVEIEGHATLDAHVVQALEDMKPFCLTVRVLGCYPNERK